MMIFFWGILAYLIYLVLNDQRTVQREHWLSGLSPQGRSELKAEEALKQRYAKGEVTEPEYLRILEGLRK